MFRKKEKSAVRNKSDMPELTGDDALFEALNKTKRQKKRKRIRIIVAIILIVLIGGFVGMRVLQRRVRTQFAVSSKEVLSAKAERGTISTLVSGSGMLVNVDTETVSVPSGVEVTEVLVKYGDIVAEGDMLATVDMASVRTVMSELQDEISSLDKEIANAKSDSVSSYVSTKVAGRVKAVYAQKDDLVEDVMVDHGSLAVLSLDGYMQAQISAEGMKQGQTVTVKLSDGTELPGTVDSVIVNRVTVLVSDEIAGLDEEVTILADDGKTLGTASLTIHNPMAITGYAGKISSVSVKENQKVYAYSTLFTLTDTSTTANYDALLRTRSVYEETLLELLSIQRNNALVAPISGSVYSVVDLDEETEEEILDIVTISPDKQMEASITVSESDILSLELNQKADVTVSSVGDEVLEGVVTEIDKTYASGYYTAVVTLDKAQGMIPGMTASVDIRIEGVDDAILIPADALHQTSSGYYVYTSYDEETKEYGGRTDVVPGLSNSNYVEIKSGLKEGDTVYYTESQTFSFGGFGGRMPGGMPGAFGGTSNGSGSGNRPSGMPGGMSGGNSGNRPSGSGNRPSSGGMPGGFGG